MSSHNYDNVLGRCIDSLRSCKDLSDKYLKNDQDVSTIIQNLTEEYSEVLFNKEKSDRALLELKKELRDKDNIDVDVEALHKKYINEDLTEFNPRESDIWKEIFSCMDIQEVCPRKERLSDAAFDKVDDSLLCSNVFKPPIDPISKILIKEPYKNSVCGHYFDYNTILNYIKERKGRAKCPYMGCANANFRAENLRLDERMKEKITEYLQIHDESQEYSDDE